MNPLIVTWVEFGGQTVRIPVDREMFIDAFTEIADEMRARGLTGIELDEAIRSRLPSRLAQLLVAETMPPGMTRH